MNKYLHTLILLLFLCAGHINAQPLDAAKQLNIYDCQGNMLMYVKFEYNSNGENIGRTVYNWQGYLLRRTEIKLEDEKVALENYLDGSGELRNKVTPSYKGTIKTSSIFDEFNTKLFETSYDTASPDNSYDLSNAGRVLFEYGIENKIRKISVLDTAGNPIHYATVQYNVLLNSDGPGVEESFISSLKLVSPGRVRLNFTLGLSQRAKAQLFNLQGNPVNEILNRRFQKGRHSFILEVLGNNAIIPNGIYILKFSLEDKHKTCKIKVVK